MHSPDDRGGFWVAARQRRSPSPALADVSNSLQKRTFFYHYTDSAPRPVFTDVFDPISTVAEGGITSAAGGSDGSFWVSTSTNVLYRYDRLTGWDHISIPGWNPPRQLVGGAGISAVAVGPSGEGVAVGPGGRIADLRPDGDPDAAAGVVCDLLAPTSLWDRQRLSSVSVRPDGSAITVGENLTLLWRPAAGDFRRIALPRRLIKGTVFTAVSMPIPGHAWLATNRGEIYSGQLSGDGVWSWRLEDTDVSGQVPALDGSKQPFCLCVRSPLTRRVTATRSVKQG